MSEKELNVNDRFEIMAKLFFEETGLMAPGKDISPAVGDNHWNKLERATKWAEWIEKFQSDLFKRFLTHPQPTADVRELAEKIFKEHILPEVGFQSTKAVEEWENETKKAITDLITAHTKAKDERIAELEKANKFQHHRIVRLHTALVLASNFIQNKGYNLLAEISTALDGKEESDG